MSSTRWPLVVAELLDLLPTLPGWATVKVYDTAPVTAAALRAYAIVGPTSDNAAAGAYTRTIAPSGLISENGTIRVLIVTQTGNDAPAQVRTDGFALADALADALAAGALLDVLGTVGTADLLVSVQSSSTSGGLAQSLVATVTYTSLR